MNYISEDKFLNMIRKVAGAKTQVVGVKEKNYKRKEKINSVEDEVVKVKENFKSEIICIQNF